MKQQRKEFDKEMKKFSLEQQNQLLKGSKARLELLEEQYKEILQKMQLESKQYTDIQEKIEEMKGKLQKQWLGDKIRFDELAKMKIIICIGITGSGKSTLLNRLHGDKSSQGDKGYFKVGHEYQSETDEIRHKMLVNDYANLNDDIFCTVDTPGALDSYGKDKMHENNIATYLRGCGGVNAFLVFFSLRESRVDAKYVNLLKHYSTMLDSDEWWHYVTIVATNLDILMFQERFELGKLDNDEKRRQFLQTKLYVQYRLISLHSFLTC